MRVTFLQQQLSEAKEYLQAATRLSEQLEKKDEQIERFNEEGSYSQVSFIFNIACILLLVYGMVSVSRLIHFVHHEKRVERVFSYHHIET